VEWQELKYKLEKYSPTYFSLGWHSQVCPSLSVIDWRNLTQLAKQTKPQNVACS
jgi:hypothetical protein